MYTFQYDSYGRLLHSYFSENTLTNSFEFTENVGDYDEVTDYDANGNITSLSRFHSGELMDELIYSYESLSNKLISVSEAADISLYNNKKHFIPCAEEVQYDYDLNCNLVRDNNKGIQFEYNYMNLVGRARRTDDLGEAVLTNGNGQFDSKVHFYYDASGNKLYKRTPTQEKYYFGNLEFSNDQDIVLYIPNGRVRLSAESNNEFVYDFFISDYLGNVRAIISNENAQVDQVVLTMEVNRIEEEEDDFYNVSPARVTRPITMPYDNTYGYNSKSAELTSSKDAGQGPGRMIPVKQGDLIDLSTKYWFEDLAIEDNRLTIAQIVQTLALSLISSGGDVVDNIESLTNVYTNSQSLEYLALSNLVAEMFEDVDLSKPQAFMIYLSLNEKFVASNSPYSGFIQVTEANQLGALVRDQLKMPLNGYFHVFLVNASSKPVNFDNMTVNVIKANVLQQMDYYPFGLMFQKQDVNATNNLLWHHGKELQENEFAQQGKSIDLEDFGARMYDPIVARWWSVDPLVEQGPEFSPFSFCFNNPTLFIDPNGMWPIYGKDGAYLGDDGKFEEGKDLAFTGTAIYDDNGEISGYENLSQFTDNHTEFKIIANIVRQESLSSDSQEDLWIAHASNNSAKYNGLSLFERLMSSYSKVEDKTGLKTSNNTSDAKFARAAVIELYSGGQDPTGGARAWDGVDFLAWGLNAPDGKPHNKFEEYSSVTIPSMIYYDYKNAVINKYGSSVGYYGERYSLPASVFMDKANWGNISNDSFPWKSGFVYNTGVSTTSKIVATGTTGLSIFWKIE